MVGENIRKIRESLGMSQKDLARKLNMIHVQISYIENGKRNVDAKLLIELHKVGFDPIRVLYGDIYYPEPSGQTSHVNIPPLPQPTKFSEEITVNFSLPTMYALQLFRDLETEVRKKLKGLP